MILDDVLRNFRKNTEEWGCTFSGISPEMSSHIFKYFRLQKLS